MLRVCSFIQPTASADYTVTLSSGKAKELKVKTGDAVLLVGRRRRATYATVAVKKGKKGACTVSANLAHNLRLRTGDKVKTIPLGSEEGTTGDLALLQHESPPKLAAVTFSPVEDSVSALEAREGGDEIGDDEIMERFVTPYLNLDESSSLIKKDHILTLVDDNGKKLEFIVTHAEVEGETPEEGDEGKLQMNNQRSISGRL